MRLARLAYGIVVSGALVLLGVWVARSRAGATEGS